MPRVSNSRRACHIFFWQTITVASARRMDDSTSTFFARYERSPPVPAVTPSRPAHSSGNTTPALTDDFASQGGTPALTSDDTHFGFTPGSSNGAQPAHAQDLDSSNFLFSQNLPDSQGYPGDPLQGPTGPGDGTFNTLGASTGGAFLLPVGVVNPPAKQSAATLLQYADREVSAKKLRGDTKDGYIKWCTAGPDEREAALGAMLFSVTEQLRTLKKPEASSTWKPNETITRGINKFAIRLLLSPNLAEYDGEGVVDTLMNIVEKHLEQWGLPDKLRRQDEQKWGILVTEARGIMTSRKSEIKKAIISSMNIDPMTSLPKEIPSGAASGRAGSVDGKLPIYNLCKQLSSAFGSKSHINTNIAVTIQLCTRVAFMRLSARFYLAKPSRFDYKTKQVKNFTPRFWGFVDNILEDFRQKSLDPVTKKVDPREIHRHFVNALIEDQEMFPGRPDSSHSNVLTSLAAQKPTDIQADLDKFVLTGDMDALMVDTE
ncbi:hypothetical protein VTO73DRAFT_8907 [Trametes versicolor]